MYHFYETYKRCNLLFRVLGQPSVDFIDNRATAPSNNTIIYIFVLGISIISYYIWSQIGKIPSLENTGVLYTVLEFCVSGSFFSFLVVHFTVPVLIHRAEFVRIVKNLETFDAVLKSTDSERRREKNVMELVTVVQALLLLFMIGYDCWAWLMFEPHAFLFYIVEYFTKCVMIFNTCQIAMICLFVKRRFDLINGKCRDCALNNFCTEAARNTSDYLTLNDLRRGHETLCDVIDSVNQLFGFNILTFTLVNSSITLQTMYYFIIYVINKTDVHSGDLESEFVYLIQFAWIIYLMSILFLFILVCESTTAQGTSTSLVLNKLLLDSFVKEHIRRELSDFAAQVADRAPKITAFGFFVANKVLISDIIGSLITYTIVLLQFKGLSVRAVFSKKGIGGNATSVTKRLATVLPTASTISHDNFTIRQ